MANKLTLVFHRNCRRARAGEEQEVIVPITPSELSKLGVQEVRNKVWDRNTAEVKYRPKKHGNPIDQTEFDMAMVNGPVFICAASLVVFGIVRKDTEYLAE